MASRKDFRDYFSPGEPDACWEWTGSKTARGYGRIGGQWAHRVAWASENGPIPTGLIIRH